MAEPVHCSDCEIEIPKDRALCDSCEHHRADGHVPVPLSWCHGAGPDGQRRERLSEEPEAVSVGDLTPWG